MDETLTALSQPASPGPEEKRQGTVGWDVMFWINVVLVGAGFALGLYAMIENWFSPVATVSGGAPSAMNVALLLALNLLMMGGIPFLWVLKTRIGGWTGAKEYLGLHWRENDTAWTLGLLFGLFGWAVIVTLILSAMGATEGESTVDEILGILNWPLVIFIALTAGIGEELLFRGVLQRFVGWPVQGILFGLAHSGPNQEIQVFITLTIGLAFGYARARGASLYALMIAHALYDFLLLSLVLLFPEFFQSEAANVWRA